MQMGLDEGMFGGATPMNVLLDIHRNVNHLNKNLTICRNLFVILIRTT